MIFLFWGYVTSSAQTLFFRTHPLPETYRNADITLIYEDHNSLLWFGTTQGLFSYNGMGFKRYAKNDSSSNHIRSIYQDSKGKMWVGYQDGTIYYLTYSQLKAWQPPEGLPKVPVIGFAEDEQGRFWLATYGEGVYYLDETHLYNINNDDGLSGEDIYVMVKDRLGRMWLGTDGGISICHIQNHTKHIKILSKENGLPDEIIREIIPDKNGNFWIGTYDKGFCFYNMDQQAIEYPLPEWDNKKIISHLELFDDKELWIGTEGMGIWIFSLIGKQLYQLNSDEDMAKAKVYDLHKDIEGNIWILCNTQGICHTNRQFEFIRTGFDNIQAILKDQNDYLWIGTDKGLFRQADQEQHSASFLFEQHLPQLSLNIISLYEDKFGNIWLGTFGEGLYIYHPPTGQIRILKEQDGLTNNSILSMGGTADRVWLATLGGVTEISLNQNLCLNKTPFLHRNFNQDDGLGTNFIYKVFIDSKQRTWFATDGKGISVLENGKLKNYATATLSSDGKTVKEIPLKAVYALCEDKRGHIWLGTAKEGVFEFDGQAFTKLPVKEGISNISVTGMAADKKGRILIFHNGGINILTPETHHLIYYAEAAGIQQFDPNLNVVCTDQTGNIWIGSKKEIIKYIPLNEELEIHPRTHLNSVAVFLEPIDFNEQQTFKYFQNNLVFDYFGLWYSDPNAVKYRYKLYGYDMDWISSKDTRATYSNLPPGNYSFMLTSTENDAWLDEPVVSYSFKVLTPFWKRWWFLLTVFLTLSILFYIYQKERDKRLQKENLLQKEMVFSQLETLKSQINPHFLFNSFNTLAAIVEENPELAVAYIEKLSDFYRSILQYRDKELISLQEEIDIIKNYDFLLKKRFGDSFNLHIHTNGQTAYIVPLTLQLLIENAVKHNIVSKAKPLHITIDMDEPNNYIVVSNNIQKKRQAEKSTHFGLQSLEKRYALLSGKKIKIEESSADFKVSIPVISID